jgi:glycosyltransferase involved in cell wall biosynthesis
VGILTKVLDMMAAQRPVVVTPLALEGIPELVDGVNCKLGKDREQFLDSVMALVGDARLRDRLGLEGAKVVARSYDWHDLGRRLSAILQKVMTEAEGGTASISIATEDANPRERK